MHVFFYQAWERGKEGIMRFAPVLLLILASLGTVWMGFQSALLASGLREGTVFQLLPQTLPLLFSGALYIDRFVGLFGVILSAGILLTLLSGGRGAFVQGVLAAVVVGGVLTASTLFTLVAWLLVALLVCAKRLAQQERWGFALSILALILGIFLLSGGAFLADMTVVATVSSQLPSSTVTFALLLLFGGALWSLRSFTGAYVIIPLYIVLRLCLFFLGAAPVLVLSVVALVFALAAVHTARLREGYFVTRTSLYVTFVSIPLTLIAVNLQVITAVQCFLFGGLAIAIAGMLSGMPGAWPVCSQKFASFLARFVQSALPGTFLGTGALLLFTGFYALAQQVGFGEVLYLALLGILVLCTLLFLTRNLLTRAVRIAPYAFSGIVQSVLLIAGGVFFAQILAYLGTTLGGSVPDTKIDIALQTVTLSFVPWMFFVGSVGACVLCVLVRRYQPRVWLPAAYGVQKALVWFDTRYVVPKHLLLLREKGREGVHFLYGLFRTGEAYGERATVRSITTLLCVLFIIMLIVLF